MIPLVKPTSSIKVGATHIPGSQLSQLIKLKTLPVYYQVVAESLDWDTVTHVTTHEKLN